MNKYSKNTIVIPVREYVGDEHPCMAEYSVMAEDAKEIRRQRMSLEIIKGGDSFDDAETVIRLTSWYGATVSQKFFWDTSTLIHKMVARLK